MFLWHSRAVADMVRKIGGCLLPVLVGGGAALVLLLAAGGPARQAEAGNLTFPGVCGATIQQCIDGAGAGDTILISAGDYTESLTLSKAVSLTGALSSTTILHALPNTRVLTVTGAAVDSRVLISELTFMGGLVTGTQTCPESCGGGMLITGTAQPWLRNLRLMSNTAAFNGGGLYAAGGIVVDGSQFINNAAAYGTYNYSGGSGGGLFAIGPVTLTNTNFISNTAVSGGGVSGADAVTINGGLFEYNRGQYGGGLGTGGTLTIRGTEFFSNTGTYSGGGFANYGAATVQGGQFLGNQCLSYTCYGGGMDVRGTLALTGTLFIGNRSGYGLYGGGLYGSVMTGTIVNALFAGNMAGAGPGVALYLAPYGGGVAILHTTIAQESLPGLAAVVVAYGRVGVTDTIISGYQIGISRTGGSAYEDYNLFHNVALTSTAGTAHGGHSLAGDPLFVDPAHNNYHLSVGSAAIDAGVNAGVLFDIDGAPRPYGPRFDIGYDEYTVFNVYLALTEK